jgi:hypothetical protein
MARLRIGAVVLAIAVASLGLSRPAAAQTGTERCIEELSDAEVDARYRMVYRAFEAQQTGARLWFFGWLAAFTGLAVGQSLFAAYDVGGNRPRYAAGAIGSGLSVLSFVAFPRTGIKTAFGARRLRQQPSATPQDRRARLLYAEKLLAGDARRQRLGSGILSHGQGFVWGLGAGLVLGLKFEDTVGALILGFSSPFINSLRAGTSPTGSIVAWENYNNAVKSCMAPTLRKQPGVQVSAGVGGFRLRWF